MIPYAIVILLTLLTFPQAIAMIAIYTLSVADPLSAIGGIRWGRHRIVPDKSLEGSAAFLVAAFVASAGVLYALIPTPLGRLIGASW
jgi:dolichol kinase